MADDIATPVSCWRGGRSVGAKSPSMQAAAVLMEAIQRHRWAVGHERNLPADAMERLMYEANGMVYSAVNDVDRALSPFTDVPHRHLALARETIKNDTRRMQALAADAGCEGCAGLVKEHP